MLAQSLPKFDVRDFSDYLTPSPKRKGKYLCPNCGKNDFSFNKDNGFLSCFSGVCNFTTIKRALLENYGSQVYGYEKTQRLINTLNDSKTFYRDSKQNNKTVQKYEYVDFEFIEPVTGLIEDPKDKKEFCDLLPRYALPYKHPKGHNFFFDSVTQKSKRWFYFEYDETLRICREEIKDRPSHSDKEYCKTFQVEAKVHGLWKTNLEEWIKVNQDFDPYYFRKFLYKWEDVENTYNLPNDLLYLEPENKFPRALVMAEGEKCVDLLDYYGFLATTVIGCKALHQETLENIASYLYLIQVPVIYYFLDNDEVGHSKFELLRNACGIYKIPVIPIRLAEVYKNLPVKGDIIDFLESEFFVDNYLWLEGEEHKMHPDDMENPSSRKGGYYPSRNLIQEKLVRLVEIQVKEYLKNNRGQVPIPLTVEESEESERALKINNIKSQIQLYLHESDPVGKIVLRSEICSRNKISDKNFEKLVNDLDNLESKNKVELEDVIKTAKQLLAESENESYDWLIPDYLAKGTFIVLASDSGVGKSYIGYNLAYSLATGSPFLGIQPTRKANTLIFSLDESSKTTINRLRMLGFEDLEQVSVITSSQLDWNASSNGIAQLDKFLSKNKFDLLIIDCLMQIKLDDIDENSEKVGHLIKNLRKVTERHDVCCLLLHHAKKDSDKGQFRGHGTIKDLCDDLWQLTTEKDKDGKSYNLISPQKGRFGTKNKIKYFYNSETLEIYDGEILDKDFNSKKEIEDEQKDFKLTLDEKILLILCGADKLDKNGWLKEIYNKHTDWIQFKDVFKLNSVREENWVTSNAPLTAKEILENLHYLGSQSHTSIVGAKKEVKLTFIRKQLSTLVSKGLIKTEILEESKHNEKFYYFPSNLESLGV